MNHSEDEEAVAEGPESGQDPQLRDVTERDAASTLQAIVEELAALRAMFQERLTHDETKEKAFARLYADLDACRRDAAFDEVRPLYLDLILFFDRIAAMSQGCSGDASPFESLAGELLELLARRGVEAIEVQPDRFEPKVQRAVGTVAAEGPPELRRVHSVVRRGFRWRDRLLRPEDVILAVPEGEQTGGDKNEQNRRD